MKKIITVLVMLVGLVAGLSAAVYPLEKNPIVDADIQTPYYSTGIKDKVIVENEQTSVLSKLSFMISNYEEVGSYNLGSLSLDDCENEDDVEFTEDLKYFFEVLKVNYFERYEDNLVFVFWTDGNEVFMSGYKL